MQIVCEKKQDWQLQEERRTEQVKLWDEAGDGELSQTPFGDPDGTLYFSWLIEIYVYIFIDGNRFWPIPAWENADLSNKTLEAS